MSLSHCHYRWPWIRSCLLALVLVPAFTLQGFAGFIAAPAYDAGNSANSMAVGDFNGDGIPDLAVVGRDVTDPTGKVSILLGNGDGTFQAPRSYSAGNLPANYGVWFVAVGDFNSDGYLDLAVATYAGVSIFLGNGDGTFKAARSYAVGINARFLTVVDLNGDGYLDLAVANDGDSSVTVLLGNGDGSFQAPKSYATWGATSVAVGDFNKDGHLDLAVAGPASPVSIFLGNGDGTFQAAQGYLAGNNAWSLAVGDFNGDGFPDLAVTNGDGVAVLLNAADW
jgi:hypothetical protein